MRFAAGIWSRPPAYDVGEQVPVRYHPDDPQDATVDGFWSLYLAPVIVLFLGLGVVLLAVVIRMPGPELPPGIARPARPGFRTPGRDAVGDDRRGR